MKETTAFSKNIKKTGAFGIDLGTTNSAISTVYRGTKPDTIKLSNGKLTMPSCVIWKNGEFVVGSEAYLERYKDSAIYSIKRLMQDRDVKVIVNCDGEDREFTPAEISAEILKGLVTKAGTFYGDIKDVSITVPAYFDQNGIRATEEAARLANLNVLSIVREPTAAILCYQQVEIKEVVDKIVFDLGGGTFDISIIRMTPNVNEIVQEFADIYGIEEVSTDSVKGSSITVLGIDGDSSLGGDDVDRELLEVIKRELRQHIPDLVELSKEREEQLILNLEQIKKTARTNSIHTFVYGDKEGEMVDGVFVHDGISFGVTHEHIRQAFLPTVEKASAILRKVSKETSHNATEVYLVGGTTKSFIFREMISERFPEFKFIDALNPDESVSNGAAIKAYADKFNNELVQVFDIIPMTIGIKSGDFIQPVIKKGSYLPVTAEHLFTTTRDNQTEIAIEIFQGNSRIISECTSLGSLIIKDIPPAPAEEPDIWVTLSISANNIMKCICFVDDIRKEIQLDLAGISANRSESSSKASLSDSFVYRWEAVAKKMQPELRDNLLALISDYKNGANNKQDIQNFIRENR